MRTLNDYFLTFNFSLNPAQSFFLTIPDGGHLRAVYATIAAAMGGSDAILTFEVDGVVVGETLTFVQATAVAGEKLSFVDLASNEANHIPTGQNLEIVSNGGPSSETICSLTVVIRR